MLRKIGIIGFGGFAREVGCCLPSNNYNYFISHSEYVKNIDFYVKNNILTLNNFCPDKYNALIAIGNSHIRKKILEELPYNTDFYTFIHPKAIILDPEAVKIGKGTIICANSILTTNIELGEHSILNLNTSIGHDTKIKKFFTSSPGVNISGNCNIGNNVTFGTNSAIKEKIFVCNDVVIGMGSAVTKNITEPGIYAGIPAKLLKK